MKKWFRKLLPLFLMCSVGIAAVLIGVTYFDFISRRIYNDSTGHLEEIYGQVNRSFGSFIKTNWGLLESWGDYFSLAEQSGSGSFSSASAPDGKTSDPDDETLDLDSETLNSDGKIPDLNDETLNSDGRTPDPDDETLDLDSETLNPDGKIPDLNDETLNPDGAGAVSDPSPDEETDGSVPARAQSEEADPISAFIRAEQDYWGFSEFYFLSEDEICMTLSGQKSRMKLGGAWSNLISEKEPLMASETISTGHEVIVFASPVPHGEYKGFGFDAIAVSYTNADMADSLNVDAFSGKAKCFVIHDDGTVLLSTQTGGNVFDNYLVYLKAASDLEEEQLNRLRSDWQSGTSGLLQCRIGEVSLCILYQPVGYQNYILLSAVPQDIISAGFLSVQKTTISVLIVIFLLVGTLIVGPIILRSRKMSLESRRELQYRELMFNVLSNNVDDIFLMLDADSHSVNYLSPNTERLLGIPLQAARDDIRVIGRCAADGDIVIPKKDLEAIPLQSSRYWECEYVHQKTGERRWYRMTIYRMKIQKAIKYVIVLSDRTEEQQMNQKLQEALTAARSANEAKSNFLSNMSHDIRTPMNAIVGFSVLLEKDADRPDKVREYIHKIAASSHHLLSLINDVLDMSKIESGKTSLNVDRFSLPELLDDLSIILMPQAKAKSQSLEIYVQGAPSEQLIGDRLRLNQILINLLSNAIKYTPDGGQIRFQVSELPQVSHQYARLRFVVQDNGIGMSEEFQKHIFSPFSREISSVTNKIQGTGLGMAITKNLVDLMGGIIKVQSAPGVGSTFTVELSFVLPEQEEPDPWYRQKVTRMLVADDDEDICLDIQEMMRDSGVDISCVTDGMAAVEAAVQAHHCKKDFHVILLDWKMPGMDGVEAARRIREQIGADVPILVLTSYDWADIEEEAREAGISAFMPKPFFASVFWQTIAPLFLDHVEQMNCGDAEDGVMEGRLFLVAEDNELNAEILTEILDMEGAGCELAVNGLEAVKMFENSEPGHYDMILMDVQMPVMNGYEATRQIRACSHPEAKTIPIVAMTANTFAEDVRNALDAGMDGHLAKPIDMDAVRETVSRLMTQKGEDK